MTCSAQQLLDAARLAQHNLVTGKSVREVVDTDGSRVTYSVANADRLKAYIAELEARVARGTATVSRRPMIPFF